MSWDIFVQHIPPDVQSVADMPDDYQSQVLGTRDSIIAAIQKVVPDADFADPSWGRIEGPDYSIEVSLGAADSVSSFAFHVHGGDQAVHVVADVLGQLGFRAFDPSSPSGIFDPKGGSIDGFRKWREYRDRVLGGE